MKVFYTWEQAQQGNVYDPDFGKNIQWDIPLLEGYDYAFVRNTSSHPGSGHYKGIINPDLIREVEAWGPDAILVFGWNFQSHLASLRHFHGKIPVLFRGDSTLLDEKPGIKKYIRRLSLKWVYSHVDYALYTGTNNKDYFLRHGLKESQLFFAPHAIDNQRFAEPDNSYSTRAQVWRKDLGIEKTDLVLLFAGKLETKKNPFFILELAEAIPDKRWKFIVAGNGKLEQQLKQAAAADPRILFIDFQNQLLMPVVYRLADVFIMPSTGPGETWGLAANEAMASGKSIMLSAKTGSAIDLVKGDRNGIIFNPGDVQRCIQFMNGAVSDKSALNRMELASREIIREYSFEHISTAIANIIKQL